MTHMTNRYNLQQAIARLKPLPAGPVSKQICWWLMIICSVMAILGTLFGDSVNMACQAPVEKGKTPLYVAAEPIERPGGRPDSPLRAHSFERPDPARMPPAEKNPPEPAKRALKSLPSAYLLQKKQHLYHPIIVKAANRHDLDPALVKAIIMAESGYNPNAVSKSGAKGLMQLMPGTARALGVEDIFDPQHNINGGVKYFKRLVNKFDGDLRLALAAYNAGTRKVKKYQGVPPYKATRFYIQKVFKFYEYFKDNVSADMKRV